MLKVIIFIYLISLPMQAPVKSSHVVDSIRNMYYKSYPCSDWPLQTSSTFHLLRPLDVTHVFSSRSHLHCLLRIFDSHWLGFSTRLLMSHQASTVPSTRVCFHLEPRTITKSSIKDFRTNTEKSAAVLNDTCLLAFPSVPSCDTLEAQSLPSETVLISALNDQVLLASCDTETDGGGWTVIHRRQDGSVNFYQGWEEYKKGFGDISGDFWFGLENIRTFVSKRAYEIRLDMTTKDGAKRYARYNFFYIANEERGYQLQLGKYSGNAGDSFSYHIGAKFSTVDYLKFAPVSICPEKYQSGFWFVNCLTTNPNGRYDNEGPMDGIFWSSLDNGSALSFMEMKIRPRSSFSGAILQDPNRAS